MGCKGDCGAEYDCKRRWFILTTWDVKGKLFGKDTERVRAVYINNVGCKGKIR